MYADRVPDGTREGFIVSQDGGPIWVAENQRHVPTSSGGSYLRPFGSGVTQFSNLRDAVEFAVRQGWSSSALAQWATDYGIVPASA
jgi:hypothetical protein